MANKPAEFDPNAPFEEVGNSASFDPSKPFEEFDPGQPFEEVATPAATKTAPVVSSGPAVPFIGGQGKNDVPEQSVFAEAIDKQGGWGLSEETRRFLGAGGPIAALRPVTDTVANLADIGYRVGIQAPFAAMDTAATYIDKGLDATGLADALSYDGNKFHLGNAAMALQEALPFGGLELGGFGVGTGAKASATRLAKEVEAGYVEQLKGGNVHDILSYADDNNFKLDAEQVSDFVKRRDKGEDVGLYARYEDNLQAEADAVKNRPAEAPTKLEEEASNFKAAPEPTADELFAPKVEPKPKKVMTTEEFEKQTLADLEEFKRKKAEPEGEFKPDEPFEEVPAGEAPKAAEAPAGPEFDSSKPHIEVASEEVAHIDEVNKNVAEAMQGWKNAPEVEVIHSVDDIADPAIRQQALAEGADSDALGFLGSDGKVRIIASNIDDPAQVPAVLFHEALGHYGLAQQFGAELETTLAKFYDNNVGTFRRDVDDWLESHPEAYEGQPNRHLIAAEEVLAEKSEAGRMPVQFKDTFTNMIKDKARQMGIDLKYSDREIDSIVAMAHDAVVNGKEAAADNGFKYMRKRKAEDVSTEEKKSGLLGRINTVRDVDNLMTDLQKDYPKEAVSWEDTKRAARDMNLTPSRVTRGKGVGNLAAKLHGYEQIQTNLLDEVAKYSDRLDSGNMSYDDKVAYLEKTAKLALVHSRVQNDVAEVGRALNALKIMKTSRLKSDEILKELAKNGGNLAALANDNGEAFMRFARSVQAHLAAGNPQAAANVMTKVLKPYWEDYLITGRHAAMLSGLGTHYKNVMENINVIGREFAEQSVAMVGGKVTPHEMAARAYGLVRAAIDSQTYRDTYAAFNKGYGNKQVSSKLEISNARIPGVSKVLDLLSAEDTFFRSFLDSSNLYGLGVRQAQKEGYKGIGAFQQGSHYALNPTVEMLKEADSASNTSLLVGQPSLPVQSIEKWKAREPEMSVGNRVQRFGAHILFPFARVSDRIIARRLSRSPLSFMDSGTRADWAAGGARRDIAIARTVFGSALIGYYVNAANSGDIVGSEVPYRKVQSLEGGGYQQNSVKENGQWVDATTKVISMNPLDLKNTVATDVATIVNSYKRGKIDADGYFKAITPYVTAAMQVPRLMIEGSFADNLEPVLNVFKPDEGGIRDQNTAAAGFVGGLASSMIPAAVRSTNSSRIDTTRRDTSGDKTFGGRIIGRLKDSVPEIPYVTEGSKSLPVKYDVYGRPGDRGKNLSGVGNHQNIDKDPTVVELQRLELSEKDPLVTKAPTSIDVNGNHIKLTGQAYADYQRVSGWFFLEGMKKVIQLDKWKTLNDGVKKAVVKELLGEARSAARANLYPEQEDE